MPKAPRFTIYKISRGGKTRYRIWLPARFAASGKITALYYDTKGDAQAEQALLREKFSKGELNFGNVLSPLQVKDAREALALLSKNNISLSLVEVAKAAIAQRKAILAGIPISELFDRYKATVSVARSWSQKHLSNWNYYSSRFAAAFGERNIADIQAPELREWFAANFESATYYNSALSVIAPSFSWAVKQELIERSPFDLIEKRKVVRADGVDVFSVVEARLLLSSCRDFSQAGPDHPMASADGSVNSLYLLDCTDTVLPFAVLLFAGIRPDELIRLTWSNVFLDADGGYIHVPPSAAKTRQVRHVRLRDNLRAFIDSIPEAERLPELNLIPKNWKRKSALVRKAAGLQNRHDAARHSFASYSLALDPNLDRLREDMGHSRNSDMLFKHYRSAVTREAAKAYFSIQPFNFDYYCAIEQ